MAEERGIYLPVGVEAPTPGPEGGGVLIDNRTDLPDDLVKGAVEDAWVENASMGWGHPNTFQTYANDGGGLLTRRKFQTPTNVIDEIKLARDLAERDDDVAGTIGQMIATAFSNGMENFHEDEKTKALFNKMARHMNLDRVLGEMYREFLISYQLTTVSLFTREEFDYRNEATGRTQSERVAAPLVGVLPAEYIRALDNDIFGTGTLAYDPLDKPGLKKWLDEFYDPRTTPARKAEMAREDRVTAAMFTEAVDAPADDDQIISRKLYKLNPRMVHRTTGPKGDWKYPRPLLTRNFALIEAKRLLNLMDYALLQGGMNFIVVAKKGTDDRPALPEEVENLKGVVRQASRTGVIVGDHRLSFEIITPNLQELLSSDKRAMIGRKLSQGLLRIPEPPFDAGVEAMKASVKMGARTITHDRHQIKRHIEQFIYEESERRNRVFRKGAAKVWFPKVIEDETWFTDFVLKLRDRGDIPRRWAVEAGGFDYDAALNERQREVDRGDDETLAPAAVPFSNGNPQDNNDGRPPGSSPDNGAPGATKRPDQDPQPRQRTITRNAGETVKAIWDEELDRAVRIGEQTEAILAQYPEREIGRVTPLERRALDAGVPTHDGPIAVVPVNAPYAVEEVKAVRLTTGLSILVGQRVGDEAVVAEALVFREPEFTTLDAEERALTWGFPVQGFVEEQTGSLDHREETASQQGGEPQKIELTLHVETAKGRVTKTISRDDSGNIVGVIEEPEES